MSINSLKMVNISNYAGVSDKLLILKTNMEDYIEAHNTPNSGDAASAYPSNYNQTVISPIYTVDGFTNAVPIVA